MKLYIVLQDKSNESYEIQGVFSSLDRAIAACHNDDFGWCQLDLNKEYSIDTEEWEMYDRPTVLEYDSPFRKLTINERYEMRDVQS